MTRMLHVKVAAIKQLTPLIREFLLEPTAGKLPRFSAGSNIQVRLPTWGRVLRNAYSLVSDPDDNSHYRIAVRLQEASRGGSRHLHEQVREGDSLEITAPSNLFALHSLAQNHILIAGGIGITPFMTYIEELERRNAIFELHYVYRTGLTDAYVDELRRRLGERFHTYDAKRGKPLVLGEVLEHRALGSHVYCCGPERLIAGVRQCATALGWHQSLVHVEAFAAPEPGQPFTAELVRSQRRIHVAADQSLLEALEQADIEIPNLCRGGVCGQCATRHLGGDIEHRDHYLSSDEQAQMLMPCVSRCGGRSALLLDL
ncbi:PDR/VanB family oxidoreductase (plasmid) [Cupriavidus metallidurans]|uniref:PDR/VanB family oxidoreductase n=1 Tax=Cupriavidus metallidurans TaxID=119219 RepID=UPI003D755FB6